jgi:hypothetical protein
MTRTAQRRRAIALVEAMLALVLLTMAFMPLLTTLSGARDLARDAGVLLELIERSRDKQAQDQGIGARADATGVLTPREHRTRVGRHELVTKVAEVDPYASYAPRSGTGVGTGGTAVAP